MKSRPWMLAVTALFVAGMTSHATGARWEVLGEMRGAGGGSLVQSSSGELYVTGQSGVFRSADAGATWTQVLSASVNDLDTSTNRILAGTQSGELFRSTDGGQAWSDISPAGTFGGGVIAIASSSSDLDVIYVTAYGPPQQGTNGKAFGTDDGGETWRPLASIADTVEFGSVIAVHPTDPNVIYAGGFDNRGPLSPGMFKSVDGGCYLGSGGLRAATSVHGLRAGDGSE